VFSASLRSLIASLSRTYLQASRRRVARRPKHAFRPEIEFLEGRTTPSVDMWTGANHAVDTNWSDGANWSLGRAPTSSDVVQFTNNTSVKSQLSTMDQACTVAGLQIDPLWGGTINGNGNLTLASGSANEVDSGSINIGAGLSVVNNGTLNLTGSGDVTFSGNGTLVNNGTINQAGSGGLRLYGSGNKVVTLDNTATGVYDFQTDSGIVNPGGNYSPGGTIINAGLIEKTGGTKTSYINPSATTGTLTNTGTIEVNTGTLSLQANTTDTSGSFNVAAGATLNLTDFQNYGDGFTFTENGTFAPTGSGTIVLPGGYLAPGPNGATFNIPSSIAFQVSGGAISVPANTTLTYNGLLTLTNKSSNVNLQGGGTFLLPSGSTIDQAGTGNLNLEPPASGGSVTPTLQIAAGATYNFQNTSSISDYGGGAVLNQGLIETTDTLAATPGTSQITASLTNNGGTLDAAAGTLQVADTSTNTNGAYTAAAGATLDLTGGNTNTFNETGTFTASGAGTLTIGGGTLAVANNAATLSIPSAVNFQWSGSTIDVPTNATLTVNGNLTLNGSADANLTGGGTMTENGTITDSGTGNLRIATVSGTAPATTLVIPKGSVYDFAGNTGIFNGYYAGGVVDNAGTIEKTAGGAPSQINTAFNNTGGTLSVTNGTLTLDTQSGENTGGVFNVSAGAILDLTGGNSVSYSGTYTGSGSGEVLLDAGTLSTTGGTNGATFNLPGNLFVWSGGTISTAAGNNFTLLGNMKITGSGTESLNGTGELNIGTATAAGTLNDTATGNTLAINNGGTLGINARGTLNLADDTIQGNGLLLNQGSLVKTAGTSGATISMTTDNQGKVTVNNGTLLFKGAVDQVFNGVLTGGTWTASSTSTTASTLDISSATFNTIGVSASVTLSGPNSSFSNLSSLSANQGTFNLSAGASFATAGSFTNSGSMTLSPGSTLTVNGAFAQTSTGKLTEQIGGTAGNPTCGSIVSTGAVALGGTLSVTSTVVPAVGSSFEVVNNGSAAPISGTFAGLPEGATFTVKVGATTMTFKITYVGGPGGKNVVLRRIS
jgi:hypothetical protein